MKTKILALITVTTLFFTCKTTYPLEQCEILFLDFSKGTLNGIPATVSMERVKQDFPCSTGETEEGSEFNCGGGVYYLNHGFNFYTHRDFIRIREKYSGKMSKPVLGLNKAAFLALMGTPDATIEHLDKFFNETTYVHQYAQKWGTLSFFEKEGKITTIELYTNKKIGEIEYCF